MDSTQSFDFAVNSGETTSLELTPTKTVRVKGVMLSDSAKGVKISLQTNNGTTVIDKIESKHIEDRKDVKWGENYIPVNIQTPRLHLNVSNTSGDNFQSSLVIIYDELTGQNARVC